LRLRLLHNLDAFKSLSLTPEGTNRPSLRSENLWRSSACQNRDPSLATKYRLSAPVLKGRVPLAVRASLAYLENANLNDRLELH
jgi:hypothetical protein